MIRNSNSGHKGNVINQKNTFIFILFRKKDYYYHLLAKAPVPIYIQATDKKKKSFCFLRHILYI